MNDDTQVDLGVSLFQKTHLQYIYIIIYTYTQILQSNLLWEAASIMIMINPSDVFSAPPVGILGRQRFRL